MIMAGLGGTLPILVKLAGYYSETPDAPPPQNGTYIALFLFFFLGAILCLAFQTSSLRDAIAIGIGAPALIQGFLSGQHQGSGLVPKAGAPNPGREIAIPRPESETHSGWLPTLLMSSALADARAPNQTASNKDASQQPSTDEADLALTVIAHQTAGIPPIQIDIGAQGATSNSTVLNFHVIGQITPPSSLNLALARSYDWLVAAANDKTSNLLKITEDAQKPLCVYVNATPGDDFAWALGGNRQVSVQSILLSWSLEGSDGACKFNDLLARVDDPDPNVRKLAYRDILDNYTKNKQALAETMTMLDPDRFRSLSKNGRTNIVSLLKYFAVSAWSKPQIAQVRGELASLQKRNFRFSDTAGDALRELYDRLNELDTQVAS